MTGSNVTNPSSIHARVMRDAARPLCFALHRAGRWIGVVCFGPDEYRTPKRYGARCAALADARRIAATLVRNDNGGAL
jgi:hypothetical protein